MSKQLEALQQRLKVVILNTCDTIGCRDCGLKYGDGECSATDLQGQIMDLELKEFEDLNTE